MASLILALVGEVIAEGTAVALIEGAATVATEAAVETACVEVAQHGAATVATETAVETACVEVAELGEAIFNGVKEVSRGIRFVAQATTKSLDKKCNSRGTKTATDYAAGKDRKG